MKTTKKIEEKDGSLYLGVSISTEKKVYVTSTLIRPPEEEGKDVPQWDTKRVWPEDGILPFSIIQFYVHPHTREDVQRLAASMRNFLAETEKAERGAIGRDKVLLSEAEYAFGFIEDENEDEGFDEED